MMRGRPAPRYGFPSRFNPADRRCEASALEAWQSDSEIGSDADPCPRDRGPMPTVAVTLVTAGTLTLRCCPAAFSELGKQPEYPTAKSCSSS